MLHTVRQALRAAQQRLRAAGISSAVIDSELLLAQTMALADRFHLPQDETISSAQLEHFDSLLQRRLRHEPIAYIIGRKAFWDISLKVTPAVLIPRPESELLVELVANCLQMMPFHSPYLYLDLATGSGAVLLANVKEMRQQGASVIGIGSDVSLNAALIAKENAISLGIDVNIVTGSWFTPFAPRRLFHIITCNPPYITADEMAQLPADVQHYEPHIALTDGSDGLQNYRLIAEQLRWYLHPDGFALFECGYSQAQPVSEIFQAQGLVVDRIVPDLAGIPRVIVVHHGAL